MARANDKLQALEEKGNDVEPSAQENMQENVKKHPSTLSRLQRIGSQLSQFCVKRNWLLYILVGGIALGFNLYRLGADSLWFDEILSVERARQSLPTLLQIIANTQPNMALYYVLLHFWLSVTAFFGLNPTEFVVRLPSAIFAALSSVAVFLLARRFLGMAAGLLAASIYVFNNLQLLYAQETRSYAMQLMLICLAWYALFAILASDSSRYRRRWWICFVLVTALAVYTQLFSLLILAAQMVAFTGLLFLPTPWRGETRQQVRSFLLSLLAILILILPMIYDSRHGSKTGWLPIPHPIDLYWLFLNISANSWAYLVILVGLSVFGCLVAVLAYRKWGTRVLRRFDLVKSADDQRVSRLQQLWPIAFALLCWVIVPVVLSYVVSQTSLRLFSSRYLVTIVPAIALLVGLGIAVVRWRFIQIVVVVGLLLLTLHFVPNYYQAPQAEDWNTTTAWLQQHYQPNDGIVCYDNAQGCQLSVEYYFTAYPGAAHFTSDSPGTFPWVNYDLTNHQGNADPAVEPGALVTFGANHPRIFFIMGRLFSSTIVLARARSAENWLDAHYHLLALIVTRTVTIRLYSTT